MCSSSSSSKRVCVVGLMGEQSNTVRILLRNDRKSRHRLVAPRAGARARQPTSEHLLSLGHTPTHTPVSQQRVFVACARVVRVCVCVHVHMLAFRLCSPLSPSIWGGGNREEHLLARIALTWHPWRVGIDCTLSLASMLCTKQDPHLCSR